MQITKHGHACLELTQGTERVIIDPGAYTKPMTGLQDVLAIVITHIHDDHCYEEQIDHILAQNPTAKIFGTDEVCKRLSNYSTTSVHHGDYHVLGGFTLEFFGDLHQEIHRSMPLVQNCGVMVNDQLYYPGDSYTKPDRKVEILACPASAPWLKIGDVMDFLDEVKPRRSFPTHNILLSEQGHALNNGRIKMVTEHHGGTFEYLLDGQSTTV
jgi:L-ascorbate metabolism protein UlaG (beta-lactamase superfamily)